MTTTFRAAYRARRFATLRAQYRTELAGKDPNITEIDATNAALRQLRREGLA